MYAQACYPLLPTLILDSATARTAMLQASNLAWWFFFVLWIHTHTTNPSNLPNRKTLDDAVGHERRYKILCANAVPESCEPQKATQIILDAINLETDQYRMGHTKVSDTCCGLRRGEQHHDAQTINASCDNAKDIAEMRREFVLLFLPDSRVVHCSPRRQFIRQH